MEVLRGKLFDGEIHRNNFIDVKSNAV